MGMPINIVHSSGSGPQTPIALDWTLLPFSASVAVVLFSGTASYSIERTFDDLDAITAGSARWLTDPTLSQWQTATGVTSYSTPIQFVRLNLNALSGVVELKVVQGLPA